MDGTAQLRQTHICSARTVVVKVGSNVLAPPGRAVDDERVCAIAEQVAWLAETGRKPVLVSSGAIATGMGELGMASRPATMPLLQAAASVGQGKLVAHYERHLRHCGLHAAQVLLTREDFDDRTRYLNASNTLHALLELPCVPVVNENDTISTDEIRFGDNDLLSALVTHMVRAELLVLLTSVPGVYAARPEPGQQQRVLDVVEEVNDEVRSLAYGETSAAGLGGMRSKIEAADIATRAGEAAVIADGCDPQVLRRLFEGHNVGTLFLPSAGKLSSYKRWIRFTSRPQGTIRVDGGAAAALIERGKSLLPIGITSVEGRFDEGDVVCIECHEGHEIARGLSNYSSADVKRIMGRQTGEIEAVLGHKYYDEVVHRDNLALLE